jgi:hypothetical protein
MNRFFTAGIVQVGVLLGKNDKKTNELKKFNLESARKSWATL